MSAEERRRILFLEKKIESQDNVIAAKDQALVEKDKTIEDLKKDISEINLDLDNIIENPKWLDGMTGISKKEFSWILERFEDTVIKFGDLRFSEFASESGNTCGKCSSPCLRLDQQVNFV